MLHTCAAMLPKAMTGSQATTWSALGQNHTQAFQCDQNKLESRRTTLPPIYPSHLCTMSSLSSAGIADRLRVKLSPKHSAFPCSPALHTPFLSGMTLFLLVTSDPVEYSLL